MSTSWQAACIAQILARDLKLDQSCQHKQASHAEGVSIIDGHSRRNPTAALSRSILMLDVVQKWSNTPDCRHCP